MDEHIKAPHNAEKNRKIILSEKGSVIPRKPKNFAKQTYNPGWIQGRIFAVYSQGSLSIVVFPNFKPANSIVCQCSSAW
jgi:hypothetical protein